MSNRMPESKVNVGVQSRSSFRGYRWRKDTEYRAVSATWVRK